MSSTHTPGPWYINKDRCPTENPYAVTSEDGSVWASGTFVVCSGDKTVAKAEMWTTTAGFPKVDNIHECEANARLIAAAPDLLAACKAASDILGDLAAQLNPSGAPSETHLIPLGVREQLEAALSKAEGGAE